MTDHGRFLEEFAAGERIAHPWEITVDAGMVALFQASFLDATPTYASDPWARAIGFRKRPLHPLLLLNLGLSMSVHDVSERAVAHLAYVDVRFPGACYPEDTFIASSTVIEVGAVREDRGVLHVATTLSTLEGRTACTFERKVMLRARRAGEARAAAAPTRGHSLPAELRGPLVRPARKHGFAGELAAGQVLFHAAGRTVTESEHVTLAWLTRNTHPLHTDEVYCRAGGSFTGRRVVYGGLVFAWAVALASRDVAGRAIWDVGFDRGSHPAPVHAGDTLYAATEVRSVEPHEDGSRLVKMRLVAVKNRPARELPSAALFTFERDKPEVERLADKVFEADRTLLVFA